MGITGSFLRIVAIYVGEILKRP